MQTVTVTCDLCKEVVEGEYRYTHITVDCGSVFTEHLEMPSKYNKGFDVCENCLMKLGIKKQTAKKIETTLEDVMRELVREEIGAQ